MTEADRRRWNARYAAEDPEHPDDGTVPPALAPFEALLPTRGRALELACGLGRAALWLAQRGMHVHAVDVSPVAIGRANTRLSRSGLTDRVRFEVFDLDGGLPDGLPVELLLCCNFRDVHLYPPMLDRLAPGGLLVISALSEIGAHPGPLRARPGELRQAFEKLETLATGERDGMAWFVGRKGRVG